MVKYRKGWVRLRSRPFRRKFHRHTWLNLSPCTKNFTSWLRAIKWVHSCRIALIQTWKKHSSTSRSTTNTKFKTVTKTRAGASLACQWAQLPSASTSRTPKTKINQSSLLLEKSLESRSRSPTSAIVYTSSVKVSQIWIISSKVNI